jgi:hypothetical protein
MVMDMLDKYNLYVLNVVKLLDYVLLRRNINKLVNMVS